MNSIDKTSYESNVIPEKKDGNKKKLEKSVNNSVKIKKQRPLQKFASSLFANNSKSIKQYVIEDIILPNVKELLYSIGVGSLGMLFLGESDLPKRAGRSGYSYDKVSYASPVNKSRKISKEPVKRKLDYREIIFETREDAETALRDLKQYLYEYGCVSLLNFYEVSGITEDEAMKDLVRFTDDDYGWYNLEKAHVVRDTENHGYVIEFPRAIHLD